jgi:hypothetical protein
MVKHTNLIEKITCHTIKQLIADLSNVKQLVKKHVQPTVTQKAYVRSKTQAMFIVAYVLNVYAQYHFHNKPRNEQLVMEIFIFLLYVVLFFLINDS